MYSEDSAVSSVFGDFQVPACQGEPSDIEAKIIILDPTRTVIETSAGARAMLQDGKLLRQCFDKLEPTTRANSARLNVALTEANLNGQSHLILLVGDNRLEADLITLSGKRNDASKTVIVFRSASENHRQRLVKAKSQFGLTRAEGNLLAALFEGCSVPQAAVRLGVARSTARTHLQRVFDKTGARRQGDLLRLVACA